MHVGMFISRHKDNENIPGFKPRTKMFFKDKVAAAYIEEWNRFVEEGQPGEMCRFYMSVDERDMEKTQKELACRLIREPVDFTKLENIACSIAMKAEQALTKKWLFDFDCQVHSQLSAFVHELIDKGLETRWALTPNGYSVVIDHGFDTREFLARWNKQVKEIDPNYSIELKRNAMQLSYWETKPAE